MGDSLEKDIFNLIKSAAFYHIDNDEKADDIADHCIEEIMDLIEDKLDNCFTEN